MNKKKNNKKYIVIQCLAYVAIGGLSYWIGKNTEQQKLDNMLDTLARTGKTVNNFVDGKEYILSVIEKQ